MENYILTFKKTGNIFNRINGKTKFQLTEGLIQTYSIQKLVKHALEYCNFASSVEQYNSGEYQGVIGIVPGSSGTKCIRVIFQKSKYNEQLIDNMFNTYGYFKSNIEELDDNFIAVEYESKYDEIFKQQLLKRKYIYHLTTERKTEKILENGITVHTGKENFQCPTRSYFFTQLMPDDFLKEFFNEKIENNSNYKNGTFYKVNLVLLEIDIEPIINKVKFYYDPNMDNGVYTEDYIPPQLIKIKKKINYKILKKGNGEVIERK